MDCPDEEQVLAFIDGALDPKRTADLHAHLGGCSACVSLVAASLDEGAEGGSDDAPVSTDKEEAWLEAGGRFGRYIVLSTLGAGSMGVVYCAHDPELGRQVALKVLRPQPEQEDAGRRWMLDEARAMARLSHPNVVAVYDTGSYLGQIFIAMELVEGGTLGHWRKEKRRSWREIVSVFLQAGRGLAAAHAAGLVHRDFKPENVLVGSDGAVRVTDFGLARLEEGDLLLTGGLGWVTVEPPSSRASPEARPVRSASLRARMVGSPAYMAPEQLEGHKADARSDMFSFCVALYECLSGERPIAGGSLETLRAEVQAGRIRELPRSVTAPTFLRRVLERGLQRRAGDRFRSMDELLRSLETAPVIRRRWQMGLAGAVALGAVATAGILHLNASRACRETGQRFTGIWDEARHREIEKAFLGTHLPYAADALQRVVSAFDRFRSAWVENYGAACEQSAAGRPDDALAYLRMACLTQQLAAARAKSDLFAEPDDKLVEVAAAIAGALDEPASCARVAGRSAPPPPHELERAAVEHVRERLVRARSLSEAGRFADALALAQGAVASAAKIGWPPLRAEALLELAQTQSEMDEAQPALESATEAALVAESSRHDLVAAQAWLLAVNVCSYQLSYDTQGRELMRHARAAVERIGGDNILSAHLENTFGILLQRESKFKEAEEAERRAIALYEATGRRDQFYTWLLNDEAIALNLLGRDEESADLFKRAADMKERLLGPRHPDLGISLYNLGSTLTSLGRYDEAQLNLDRAAEILRASLKPDHYWLSALDTNLGDLAYARGNYPLARSWYEQAVAMGEATQRTGHPYTIEALIGLTRTLLAQGQPEGAITALEKALNSGYGIELLDLAAAQFILARAQVAAGRDRAAALALAEKARANYALAGQDGKAPVVELDAWLQQQR